MKSINQNSPKYNNIFPFIQLQTTNIIVSISIICKDSKWKQYIHWNTSSFCFDNNYLRKGKR